MTTLGRARAAWTAAPLAAVLLLTGCSDSDPEPAPAPSPTATETATPTASPTPTSSPTPAALSPYEDRAEVRMLRKWAAAAAVDITNGEESLPRSSAFVTKGSRETFRTDILGEEVGKKYPGPIPFTPVAVQARGRDTRVFACLQVAGWGLDPKSGRPSEKRKVIGVRLDLTRAKGHWLIDHLYSSASTRCKGVQVTGVRS